MAWLHFHESHTNSSNKTSIMKLGHFIFKACMWEKLNLSVLIIVAL